MPNLYATTGDLKDRLSFEEDDSREGVLADLLEAASRWVDEQTGHRFYTATQTRYYGVMMPYDGAFRDLDTSERPWPGRAPLRVMIDDVQSVTVVATDEDGDGTYERTWTVGSDYYLSPRNAASDGKPYRYINRNVSTGRYLFPYWEASVAVTGVFGYCALASRPANIRELTLMVATLMARPVLDMTIVGTQTYKLGQELTVTMDGENLPDMGKKILEYYRAIGSVL